MGTEKCDPTYQPDINESESMFKRKQSVELSFRHITHFARTYKLQKPFIEEKQILFGVNGDFSSGTLTAIMGPSGAGKTTLLNILAGYDTKGCYGEVLINGRDRTSDGMQSFLQMSGYILQDSTLRDALTVLESMMVAAELKLGRKVSSKEKKTNVEQVLKMLGLSNHMNTLSSQLSGGQKRRLSIAYELITNPPILFLDEPTTGLDSSSCSQSISILKMLANEGRTIILTIHQPSALQFEMFDNVYALAGGHCIYNGPTSELVPYMAEKGLHCPIYHNPADFLLEVAIGEYGPVIDRLKLAYCEPIEGKKPSTGFYFPNFSLEELKEGIKRRRRFKSGKISSEPSYRNSFVFEFYYLYMRNLILLQRSHRRRLTIFFSHFLMGLLLGFTFYNAGNNASMVRSNMAMFFAILIYMVYVGLMTVSLTLPADLKAMGVEHFNQWYSLPPYYLSILSIEVPMQIINILISVPPIYYLSDQPVEIFRIAAFTIFITVTVLTAQSFGFMLGAMLPIRIGVFIGPISSCVLCVFGFSLQIKDTPFFFQICALLSYVRSAFHSMAFSMYGFGRAPLKCEDELYCHFKFPEKLLHEMDMDYVDIYANFTFIVGVAVFIHLVTYGFLHYRVNNH